MCFDVFEEASLLEITRTSVALQVNSLVICFELFSQFPF